MNNNMGTIVLLDEDKTTDNLLASNFYWRIKLTDNKQKEQIYTISFVGEEHSYTNHNVFDAQKYINQHKDKAISLLYDSKIDDYSKSAIQYTLHNDLSYLALEKLLDLANKKNDCKFAAVLLEKMKSSNKDKNHFEV